MKFSKRIWLQYWKAILPLGRGTALLKETFTHLLFSYSPLTWYRWASLWERQWSHLRAWAERCWHSPATCSWRKAAGFWLVLITFLHIRFGMTDLKSWYSNSAAYFLVSYSKRSLYVQLIFLPTIMFSLLSLKINGTNVWVRIFLSLCLQW